MDAARLFNDIQVSASAGSSKRKSNAHDDEDFVPAAKPAAKKPRASKAKADPHANAKEIVAVINASPDSFALPTDPATTRAYLVSIAQYAAALASGNAPGDSGATIAKAKTKEQIEDAADKLARTILSQIKKQMTWKPSCKGGRASWAYAGTCPDPAVWQQLMGLPAPATYKTTKITLEKLNEILGVYTIETSIRYGSLRITSNEINVKWNKDTGEFRFGGSYGL